MTPNDLLIVVPCYNEQDHLEPLLRQLVRENPLTLIIVADGGSTDSSRGIVKEMQREASNIVLLDNPARIQGAGVNLAVRQFGAERRWLVRVDAHCRYPPDYAKKLVEVAELRGAASVVVPMLTVGERCFQIAAATAQNSILGTGGSPHRHLGRGGYVDHGHHALMAIDTFNRAGGYREDMPANEDAELDCRIGRQRAAIWLEPSLAIQYFPRATLTGLVRQYFGFGRGRALTLRLHGQRPKVRQVLPVLAPLSVMASFGAYEWPLLALPLIGWLGLAVGAGLMLGAIAGRTCAFASGIAAAVMHLAWGAGFLWYWLVARWAEPFVPFWHD
jgi:succinoglycan biosynthesis protein ExoA